MVGYGAVVAGLGWVLRAPPAAASRFGSLAALEQALERGQPTLVVVYSVNCALSMAARPVVDHLERQAGSRMQVLRLEARSPAGAALADQQGLLLTPSFLLFNGGGLKEDEYSLTLNRSRVIYWLDQQTVSP
jgi:hypothetical protein